MAFDPFAIPSLPTIRPGIRYIAEDGKPDPTFLRHMSDLNRALTTALGRVKAVGSIAQANTTNLEDVISQLEGIVGDILIFTNSFQDQLNIVSGDLFSVTASINDASVPGGVRQGLNNLGADVANHEGRIQALEAYVVAHP